MFTKLLLSANLAAAAVLATSAQAQCRLEKVATLHPVVENNQILIPGTLEGHQVKFLFDTSFPVSIIPAAAAKRLGIDVQNFTFMETALLTGWNLYAAEVTEGTTKVQNVDLDGHTVRMALFGVYGTKDTFGTPDTVAVLGTDFWGQYDVEIDLKDNAINLYHPQACAAVNLAYWGDAYNVVDMEKRGWQSMLKAKLNGHSVAAVLDTGTRFSNLTERAAGELGAQRDEKSILQNEPRMADVQPTDLLSLTKVSYGVGIYQPGPDIGSFGVFQPVVNDNRTGYWLAKFNNFTMDEESISPARLRVVPTPRLTNEVGSRLGQQYFAYDMVLGVDFLLAHRVMISNSQMKFYFSHTGGPALQSVSARSAQ